MRSFSPTRALCILLTATLAIYPPNLRSQENAQLQVNHEQEKAEYFCNTFVTGFAVGIAASVGCYIVYKAWSSSTPVNSPTVSATQWPSIIELVRNARTVKDEVQSFLKGPCMKQLGFTSAFDSSAETISKKLLEQIELLNVWNTPYSQHEDGLLRAIRQELIELRRTFSTTLINACWNTQ